MIEGMMKKQVQSYALQIQLCDLQMKPFLKQCNIFKATISKLDEDIDSTKDYVPAIFNEDRTYSLSRTPLNLNHPAAAKDGLYTVTIEFKSTDNSKIQITHKFTVDLAPSVQEYQENFKKGTYPGQAVLPEATLSFEIYIQRSRLALQKFLNQMKAKSGSMQSIDEPKPSFNRVKSKKSDIQDVEVTDTKDGSEVGGVRSPFRRESSIISQGSPHYASPTQQFSSVAKMASSQRIVVQRLNSAKKIQFEGTPPSREEYEVPKKVKDSNAYMRSSSERPSSPPLSVQNEKRSVTAASARKIPLKTSIKKSEKPEKDQETSKEKSQFLENLPVLVFLILSIGVIYWAMHPSPRV